VTGPGTELPTLPFAPAEARVPRRDERWLHAAGRARLLSWLSLAWMTAEGALGVLAGAMAGSVALVGWGLGSAIEGLAAVIVIWRFTGSRTHSESAERRAERAVAVSFFLLAPCIAVEAVRSLVSGTHPDTSVLGIAVTASSVVLMPALGLAKRRLGEQLGSGATRGEGTQNLLCAAQGAAVLVGLALNAAFGAWWLDGVVALGLSAFAVKEGREAWRGEGCCVAERPDAAACGDDCCAHGTRTASTCWACGASLGSSPTGTPRAR
jgi:divalent metal cation (Fe/Co/Zn/Cd) transporter